MFENIDISFDYCYWVVWFYIVFQPANRSNNIIGRANSTWLLYSIYTLNSIVKWIRISVNFHWWPYAWIPVAWRILYASSATQLPNFLVHRIIWKAQLFEPTLQSSLFFYIKTNIMCNQCFYFRIKKKNTKTISRWFWMSAVVCRGKFSHFNIDWDWK